MIELPPQALPSANTSLLVYFPAEFFRGRMGSLSLTCVRYAGVAAILLAMRDGVLPPTINVDEADPQCDLDYIPEVGRKLNIEHAVANCIAFGSKNSAFVLRRV